MRIHLKDPKYLYNKNIYEKIFREMKLESNSIKNIMKIYSSKIVKKKKRVMIIIHKYQIRVIIQKKKVRI